MDKLTEIMSTPLFTEKKLQSWAGSKTVPTVFLVQLSPLTLFTKMPQHLPPKRVMRLAGVASTEQWSDLTGLPLVTSGQADDSNKHKRLGYWGK